MISGNNQILLGDILRNFAAMEKHMDELKYQFNPSKLMLKNPTELANFNETCIRMNRALKDCIKFLD